MKSKRELAQELLTPAGITLNGPNAWDPQIHDERVFARLFSDGLIAIGESYMDGWWDVVDMPEMVARMLRARKIDDLFALNKFAFLLDLARSKIFNLQNKKRAWQVGEEHYDLGNDLFEKMLDAHMMYTCGYWSGNPEARNLEEAQEAKLELICKKIGLKRGDHVLDVGCGWGGFAIYAAKRYGARVTGITISKEQIAFAKERAVGLPIDFVLQDYRDMAGGPYDKIIAVGFIEAVGPKNYRTFMELVKKHLKDDGIFLLQTIGWPETGDVSDPWIDKYIFPNGILPSVEQLATSANGLFVLEDWHNFGADYEKTLLAWDKNFEAAWPELREKYGDRFYRMWKFYLYSTAGSFRARTAQLWQIVFSKQGIPGGHRSVR